MNPKDVRPNMRFGKLTTICELPEKKSGHIMWECQCDCGEKTILARDRLAAGKVRSCGCLIHELHGGLFKDMTNQRFGRLVVIEQYKRTSLGIMMWKCQCDCGKTVNVRGSDLRNGKTTSCGCRLQETKIKHGGYKERLYSIWKAMKDRCNNPNNKAYKNYGGIGIKVCHEWEDYNNFREWAFLNGYDEKAEYGECSIDRINVDGNYEPDNCRWITMYEQQFNRHTNVFIEKDGKIQTLTEWCRELNLNESTIRNRYRKGWTIDHLFDPIKVRKKQTA